MAPWVTVIIPNWNGRAHLPTCLEALRGQTFHDFRAVVVDNGSTDDSVPFLRSDYPEVEVLRLPKNVFFSGAVNEGIRQSESPLIALLNNDTEAEPLWLEELVRALDEHPEAGMAASKMLLFDRRDVLNSAGDFYGADGIPGNRGVWERDEGQYDAQTLVFGACAGAALYRRSMLDDIGLFDEDFVGYCEDVDLSFRAQLGGYRCVFAPKARVYHRLSATGGGRTASYLCGRNFIGVIVKDMPGSLIGKHWCKLLATQVGYALHSLWHARELAARARLRGQLAGLAQMPKMLEKRRSIQASRRVRDEYIESILSR
ncbi:MAG: glycosyltransferase family 2 protein [Chloroflexi bacterium]|nr:glycosyltransferase family 2 protein [Chloroflexota bacterium]